jgi:transcription elongation factor GreA
MKRRQDEFANLMNVKIPENSRAIGVAAAHGDLSENGEYTAALEEQQMLIGKANRMKEELEKARFIESQEIRIDVVMPGTRVILKNLGTQKDESYVVLGPWDADPDRCIVAYTAPLGRGLLGRKVGERAVVDLPEGKAEYQVVGIEHAL